VAKLEPRRRVILVAAPLDAMQGAEDGDLAGIEVQIRPLQSEHLALAHAGGDSEHVQRLVAVAANGFEKRASFVGREEGDLRKLVHLAPLGGAHPRRGRVRRDVLPIDGELQSPPQYGKRILWSPDLLPMLE
jgi:hypothetical protein